MSKSNYDWLIVYRDGHTKIVSGTEIEDFIFEIEQEDVTAIIRQELS